MVNIGFWELGLLALLVVLIANPKRLPAIVRRCGYWLAKFRRLRAKIADESDKIVQDVTKEADTKDKDGKDKR